jgi:hypothetical protein
VEFLGLRENLMIDALWKKKSYKVADKTVGAVRQIGSSIKSHGKR